MAKGNCRIASERCIRPDAPDARLAVVDALRLFFHERSAGETMPE